MKNETAPRPSGEALADGSAGLHGGAASPADRAFARDQVCARGITAGDLADGGTGFADGSLLAGEAWNGRTVLDALRRGMGLSRGHLAHLKALPDGILVNGERSTVRRVLRAGDLLRVHWDDDPSAALPPEERPLAIVCEDAWLLAVDKPPGLAVHPAKGHPRGTLANAVSFYCGGEAGAVVRPLNRLDRDTSGLVLMAKNRLAARLDRTGTLVRAYAAIVRGRPPAETGLIDAPLGRAEPGCPKRLVRPDGAPARTRYRVAGEAGGHCLLALRLETGRTHQIRVHLAHLGCPVAGDRMYGDGAPPARQALHACALALTHPVTGEPLRLFSPPPEDLRSFWTSLGGRPEAWDEAAPRDDFV